MDADAGMSRLEAAKHHARRHRLAGTAAGIAAFSNVSAATTDGGCAWLKPTGAFDARREWIDTRRITANGTHSMAMASLSPPGARTARRTQRGETATM